MKSQHVSDLHMKQCVGFRLTLSLFPRAAVTFEIGDRSDPKTPNNEEEPEWECVWKCHTATPVHHMSFSPDGTLFATSGKSDRLVKIWYENKNGEYPNPDEIKPRVR